MSSATKVFENTKLLTRIFDFLDDESIRNAFIKRPNKQILIYGQVQSGKTAKIMEYIKKSNIRIKILMIQNSLSMLSQYERSLNTNKIKFYSVSQNNSWVIRRYLQMNYASNVVLIVMNNNYRRTALDEIVIKSKIRQYSLIMDESDLYHKNMKSTLLYKKATECVHVTATPFRSEYKGYFDDILVIPPKKEYIGLNKLDIKFIPDVVSEYETTMKILSDDFLKSKQGIMLINIHSRISGMEDMSRYLFARPSLLEVPIVMISSKNTLYFNKKTKELSKMSVSEIISGLEEHQHIILIANRLATRGINYSNLTYTRHLTHQIIKKTDSKTNFIQRCRILGNKEGVENKLKLYCLNCDENYFGEVLEKVENISKDNNVLKVGYVEKPPKLVRAKTM